jgi:hypothetical protein
MAYLLEFPPSTLPDNICAPPYVIFGINGQSVVNQLPPRIPLNAVLHFAPKLAQWILPAPENFPPKVAQGVQRTPFVGIDIRLNIGPASLQRIIFKILQSAGLSVPKHLFLHPPSLITSISIRRTWLLLELPRAGLDGLHIHIQTRLMMGPPVTFAEMKELWADFPAESDMLRVMAINFVQSHIALYYGRDEFSAIRHWYLSTKERYKVFKAAEDQFPDFGKKLSISPTRSVQVNNNVLESKRKAKVKEEVAIDELATQEALARKMNTFEKKKAVQGPRQMSTEDIRTFTGETTIRKSLKWRSAPDLKGQTGSMDGMSALLSEALRKVQLERESGAALGGEEETS